MMRECTNCCELMHEGYMVDASEYYCDKECLNTKYTDDEWEQMYDDGNNDDTYYTEWEVEDADPDLLLKHLVNELEDSVSFMETLEKYEDAEGQKRREDKIKLIELAREYLKENYHI